jgi:hypothetical protein
MELKIDFGNQYLEIAKKDFDLKNQSIVRILKSSICSCHSHKFSLLCSPELFEIDGKAKQYRALRSFPYRYPFYFSLCQKVVLSRAEAKFSVHL